MKTYVKNRVRTYLLITLIPLITSIAVYAVTFSALSSAIKKTEQSVFSAFTEYFEASLETAIEKTHKIVYGYDYISLDRSDVSLGVDDDKFTTVKEKLFCRYYLPTRRKERGATRKNVRRILRRENSSD